jgi:Integrase core domain
MIHRTTSCRGLKTEVPKGVAQGGFWLLLRRFWWLPDVQPRDRAPDQHPLHFRRPLKNRKNSGLRGSFCRSAAGRGSWYQHGFSTGPPRGMTVSVRSASVFKNGSDARREGTVNVADALSAAGSRPGHERTGDGHRLTQPLARRDHPRRPRHPVHLLGLHLQGEERRPAALARHRRRPYDNAVVESFWGRMQVELLNRQRWRTRVELANAIFEYMEGFHNRRRRHSYLDWATPLEFETKHRHQATTPHDPFRETRA